MEISADARPSQSHICRRPHRNGGRHRCQPPSAPRHGSAGVR